MSQHDQQIDTDDVSIAELVEQQQMLVERVGELEETVEQKEERIDELETGLTIAKETVFELEDAVTGDHGSWKAQKMAEDSHCVLERIGDIERGEVDPGEVVANSNAGVDHSDLLPLHNMYLSAQNQEPGTHGLTNNQEIAARLFPFIGQYAFSNEGQMVLPSTKVADILEREIATPELAQRLDVENPNTNTIRRAMKFVGKFGKDMMEFDDSEKTNRILIDRDAWTEYTKKVTGMASGDYDGVNTDGESPEADETTDGGVDEEFDRLTEDVITVS